MDFVDKAPCLHSRVFIHDLLCLFDTGVEYADAAYVAAIHNRADNRKQPLGAQSEISSAMFPYDFFYPRFVSPRPGFQNNDRIILRSRKHLTHIFVGDCLHEVVLQKMNSRVTRAYSWPHAAIKLTSLSKILIKGTVQGCKRAHSSTSP